MYSNAGRVRCLGKPAGERDFYCVPAAGQEPAGPRIVELVAKRIPLRFGFDAIKDIQVLRPMNRGGVGARSLNIELQAALNPLASRRSSASAGPSPRATRACRLRTITTRMSTTGTSA